MKVPYIIAELSCNHCQNLNKAKKIIDLAKKSGADAVKLQTYTADSMTLNLKKKNFKISDGLWKNKKLWDLYDKASTPYEWHAHLFKHAKKKKIKIFSSPFDEHALILLEKLNCPIYKIASFEMTDLNLVKQVAKTKKPMIISTGMASIDEIAEAYYTAKKNGCRDITLLYCVSNYPSKVQDFNLNNIKILKKKFNCKIGFSDHSNDPRIASAAVAAGAVVFEKHLILNKNDRSFDRKFSVNGKEFLEYKKNIDFNFNLLGKDKFIRSKSENKSKIFRRSIYVIKNIKKGEKFTKKNIKTLRPALGIEAKFFEKLLYKKSFKNFRYGEVIKKNILKKLR